ncbi:MAG: DMT family transporter [Steroidobacteraceae bacterium]|nr:DMT family transporter [Steroidobacteraceae bacterium]
MSPESPEERALTARRIGMLCVALSAMLFASKGLFGKALYARGVGFELLVAVRACLAMPLFIWIALRRGPAPAVGGDEEAKPLAVRPTPAAKPRARAVLAAALAGITCYYVGALVDFWALTMIDASIERVLLFSYPAMVVLWHSVAARRVPEARILLAMFATYLGIFFAMGGVDLHELRANLFGAALVLVAALTTAIYFLIGERYTRELGSTRFAAIGMSSAAILLALHFVVFRSFDEIAALQAYDWVLLGILGIACMFIPGLLQAEGMRRVGAQRAAIGSTIGPPTTILLAALFLNERLTGWQLLGTALIVASVLVLSLKK